jgi:hypothetical protein
MNGRFVEAREFQPRVKCGLFAGVVRECIRIASAENIGDGLATLLIFDTNKAPGLAVADGRRENGERHKFFDHTRIDLIAAKAAHIAAPAKKLREHRLKSGIEKRRRDASLRNGGQVGHRNILASGMMKAKFLRQSCGLRSLLITLPISRRECKIYEMTQRASATVTANLSCQKIRRWGANAFELNK